METIILLSLIPSSLFAWYWLFFRKYNPGMTGIRRSTRTQVFPFIEAYSNYKTAALKSVTKGPGAEFYIQKVLGKVAQGLPENEESAVIFHKYLQAMTAWSKEVDLNFQDKEKLSHASKKLELEIDQLAPMCEKLGWKFKNNWR
jgi:hypothetical protein